MSSQAPDWLILPGASRAVLIDPSDWSTKGERGGNAAERGESRKGGGGICARGREQVQQSLGKILAPARMFAGLGLVDFARRVQCRFNRLF
jgi:hypothetical protein